MNKNIKKYGANSCPECGNMKWTALEDAYGLVKVDTNTSPVTIRAAQVLIVNPTICNNCGYTKFYLDESATIEKSSL